MEKTILITGGSRGIGAATARLAAGRGYRVAFGYRADHEAARGVVQDIEAAGGRALAIRCDVAEAGSLDALFAEAERGLGPPAVLVNNAGITGPASRLDAADPATVRRVLDVNLTAVILASRLAVRRMSTRHGGAGGCIVNLSSAAATLGSPGEFTWYAASKAAVDTFTLGLAREVARDGIRVNAVAPGLIDTTMHRDTGIPDRLEALVPSIPMERAAAPEEVAEAILWLASDAAGYVTGETLRVAGGR